MYEWVDRWIDRVGGLLLPPRCVLCGARGQPPCVDLCAACEASLPVAEQPCLVGPAPLQRIFAPFAYGHPADHLVHALKYRGQLAVARVLGGLLGQRVELAGLAAGVDIIVPVPLHPQRHAERGFNQSHEIARWVVQRLRCRLDATLAVRQRDTHPQVGLSGDERRRNLQGAFAADARVRGLRIALVDDVLTTGTTLCELGRTLQAAGARTVEAWCVERAPDPKQVDLAHQVEVRYGWRATRRRASRR
jgi:ComF family protein